MENARMSSRLQASSGQDALPEESINKVSTVANRMGLLLIVLAAVLYFATLDNGLHYEELTGLVGGDLITFHYGQYRGGPGNAPGYPLYMIGGWLWFHGVKFILNGLGDSLPNPVSIISAYSTIWALLALWLFYRLLLYLNRSDRNLQTNWLLPWTICFFYALTSYFWHFATRSEQYCSAVAQNLALVFLFLKWEETRTREEGSRDQKSGGKGSTRLLFGMAFLSGLCLANLVTVAFIVPFLTLAILQRQPGLLRRPKIILQTILFAAAPLLSYIFIYFRVAANPSWLGTATNQSHQEWFWSFITSPRGRNEIYQSLQLDTPFNANGFPQAILNELSLPILVLGLVGIAMLRPRLRNLTYGTLLVYVIFCWAFRYGHWQIVFIPAYPLVLLGLLPLSRYVRQKLTNSLDSPSLQKYRTVVPTAVPVLVLVVAIGWAFTSNWERANKRDSAGDTAFDEPALLLAQQLPPDIALYAESPLSLGIEYLTTIWGIRPDLNVTDIEGAAELLAKDRPVAVTRNAARYMLEKLKIEEPLDLLRVAPGWILLVPDGAEAQLPPADKAPMLALGEGILLAAYATQASRGPLIPTKPSCVKCVEANGSLDVTLYWQVEENAAPGDWRISVRARAGEDPVTTQDGNEVREDSPAPVDGLRPFSSIAPGQTVLDSYRLAAAANADSLFVILYRSVEGGGFQHLAELTLPIQ